MPGKFTPPTACVKCGGAMEAGESVDDNHGWAYEGSMFSPQQWWKVQPREKKALWWLLSGKGQVPALVKPEGGPFAILHYRCVDCGYLESYAPGKPV